MVTYTERRPLGPPCHYDGAKEAPLRVVVGRFGLDQQEGVLRDARRPQLAFPVATIRSLGITRLLSIKGRHFHLHRKACDSCEIVHEERAAQFRRILGRAVLGQAPLFTL
jgi:hypothetical protein